MFSEDKVFFVVQPIFAVGYHGKGVVNFVVRRLNKKIQSTRQLCDASESSKSM